MRDGIEAARAGLPSVSFVTEKFERQGVFVARAEGMPDVPQVILPHPIAGIGKEAMSEVATNIGRVVVESIQQN